MPRCVVIYVYVAWICRGSGRCTFQISFCAWQRCRVLSRATSAQLVVALVVVEECTSTGLTSRFDHLRTKPAVCNKRTLTISRVTRLTDGFLLTLDTLCWHNWQPLTIQRRRGVPWEWSLPVPVTGKPSLAWCTFPIPPISPRLPKCPAFPHSLARDSCPIAMLCTACTSTPPSYTCGPSRSKKCTLQLPACQCLASGLLYCVHVRSGHVGLAHALDEVLHLSWLLTSHHVLKGL
jgi:hypothetical protein